MNNSLIAILIAPALLAACAGAPGRRQVYVEDVDGIRSRLEEVKRELSPSVGTGAAKVIPAPAVESQVKTLSRNDKAMAFESEGEGYSTKYERPVDAERRAEEDALAKAVKTAGVNVYSGFQNIENASGSSSFQFVGKYLNVWSNALVSYERLGVPVCSWSGETHRCTVKIAGTVYFTGAADPNFTLKAALDKPAYFDDDNLSLLVSVAKDAYLTIFHCDEDGQVTLIFPNRHARRSFLPAGAELAIPGDLPFRLAALLPPGREETGELLHVIATKKQPLLLLETLSEERVGIYTRYSLGGLKDLAVKLSRLDREDWTAQVLIYQVKKRPQ